MGCCGVMVQRLSRRMLLWGGVTREKVRLWPISMLMGKLISTAWKGSSGMTLRISQQNLKYCCPDCSLARNSR